MFTITSNNFAIYIITIYIYNNHIYWLNQPINFIVILWVGYRLKKLIGFMTSERRF